MSSLASSISAANPSCARSAFFTAWPIDCMIGSPQNHDAL
jgi:hypothetical protein